MRDGENVLIRTLVELADNLVEDFDVVDLLVLLTNRTVEALEVDAAGVMLAAPSGSLQVIASSSDTMRVLELFELQADEGPCVDCYATGQAIANVDLLADTRWPEFAKRALIHGFRSVHAIPLRLRGTTIGALNMFRTDRGTLDDADVAAAQALADIATIAIIQYQVASNARTLNLQLSHALESRVAIEQAKGIISTSAGVDMTDAFQRLRSHARNHNLHLSRLAADVSEGSVLPEDLDPPR
jgi:GAF domain-containing protein